MSGATSTEICAAPAGKRLHVPIRADIGNPRNPYSAADFDTGRYGACPAHNPKFRGTAAGPRRVGENPPVQRVGRFVGRAAGPVLET